MSLSLTYSRSRRILKPLPTSANDRGAVFERLSPVFSDRLVLILISQSYSVLPRGDSTQLLSPRFAYRGRVSTGRGREYPSLRSSACSEFERTLCRVSSRLLSPLLADLSLTATSTGSYLISRVRRTGRAYSPRRRAPETPGLSMP